MRTLFSLPFVFALTSAAHAQDPPYREELKRPDLTRTNMEEIVSVSEIKPGESTTLHFHHDEEPYYFLEGGTIDTPDGEQVPIPTGQPP